jgi:hypothetical protein
MATTISRLNYMLTVDASGIDKGLIASRKELNQFRRDMRKLQTPMEKYETQLAKAKPLLKLGAEGQELYNRKIRAAADALKREQKAAWQATKTYKVLRRAKQAVIGLGVGLGFGAVAVLKRQFEEVDKLAKASARLNIELEELTALQFAAATTSGLANDQTLKGLEKMVRRVSEAAAGTGEAKASLEELGLEAEKLTLLKPDEMFLRIADRMQLVADKGSKLRLATKIFDDESAGIFTLLEKGADDIGKMTDRAKELGMTISSLDAAKVEAANDAMTELTTAFTAFSRQWTTDIAPHLTAILKDLTKAATGDKSSAASQLSPVLIARDIMLGLFRKTDEALGQPIRPDSRMPTGPDLVAQRREREEIEARINAGNAAFNASAIANMIKDQQVAGAIGGVIGSLMGPRSRPGEMQGLLSWVTGGSQGSTTQASKGYDVLDSVRSGSAEAFKLEFKRVAKEDAQLKETKRTANNTEETNNLLESLLERFNFEEANI